MIRLDDYELTVLIDALARSASRHEAQARSIKFGRRHDDRAAGERTLRTRLMRARMEVKAAMAMGDSSVQCPHCRWGFFPSVIDQHIREKHGAES